MRFEGIELRIKEILQKGQSHASGSARFRVKNRALRAFEVSPVNTFRNRWSWFFSPSLKYGVLSVFVLGLVGTFNTPFTNNQTIAGKVKTEDGVVEVIRGNESYLINDEADLYVGDWIKVGNRGKAQFISDNFASRIKPGTKLRVLESDEIFLAEGSLQGTSLQDFKVRTKKGLVQGQSGSGVAIEVNPTGETRVLPTAKTVQIFDLHSGQLMAARGEEVLLRSDTFLQSAHIPQDLSLSNDQIAAALGKLAIARSKILTGVKKMLDGERNAAHRDIVSAEKTFRSILQVFETTRDLEITKRVNTENYTLDEVFTELALKTQRADILTEALAVKTIFDVLAYNKNNIAFAPVDTGVKAYDRYVLLGYLASLGDESQSEVILDLADTYVISVLQKVQNQPVKIDQIATLNEAVDQLPANTQAREFLEKLSESLAPDLAQILQEKVDYIF